MSTDIDRHYTRVLLPTGDVYGLTMRDAENEAARLRRAGFIVSVMGDTVHVLSHLRDEKPQEPAS